MTTAALLSRAQCAILFALDLHTRATETQLLSFCHLRAITLAEAQEGMLSLIEHNIVQRQEPLVMSGEQTVYSMVARNGAINLDRAKAETMEHLSTAPIDTITEVAMRRMRTSDLTLDDVVAALVQVGFIDHEIRDFVHDLPASIFIECPEGADHHSVIGLTPTGRTRLDAMGAYSFVDGA